MRCIERPEKSRQLRPVLFGNCKPYLREYDLLAVEVGQSGPGRPELVKRVGKPGPSEDPQHAPRCGGYCGV
jgi:hypothetical protein